MLRKIMLTRKKTLLKDELDELRKKGEDFVKREKELKAAIEEVKTEEEQKVVGEMIDKFEAEKKEYDENVKGLEEEIGDIEKEIDELEDNEPGVPTDEPEPAEPIQERKKAKEEKEIVSMTRRKYFGGNTRETLKLHVERDDVKDFLERAKNKIRETRGVKEADLLIPTVTLELLRDSLHEYSKLISKVRLRKVAGKARQTIAGSIPEAIWMEACSKLSELSFGFNEVEIDGYKVGGFIPICNATLEDADPVDLYNEILYMLGQAIGLAIDKAILYGTGKKMPLGIVTRLAQAAKPEGYSDKDRKWENLSTSNLVKLENANGADFFTKFLLGISGLKSNYATKEKFWVMNDTTKNKLMAKALTFDASGAIVAKINNEMPVIGGEIITLPFVPEGDMIGGYGELYLLGERAGATFAASEHANFIEDNTLFKGTARYDGRPIIAEAFIGVNIENKDVTKILEFAKGSEV